VENCQVVVFADLGPHQTVEPLPQDIDLCMILGAG
jgi:hypothetical protein